MSYICKVDVTSNNMKHAQIALNAWNYGTVVQEDVEELKLSIANDIVVQVRGEDDGARKRRGRGEEEAMERRGRRTKRDAPPPFPVFLGFPVQQCFGCVCAPVCGIPVNESWYSSSKQHLVSTHRGNHRDQFTCPLTPRPSQPPQPSTIYASSLPIHWCPLNPHWYPNDIDNGIDS